VNFYAHHLGDYARNTRHLSMVEHGAYRLLIDLYYVREALLPLDEPALFRLVCARTDDEKLAVTTILAEFFVRTEDGWRHTRCDEEIAKGQEKQAKARASAAARWDANAMRTQCKGNAPNPNPNPNPKAKEKNKEGQPALVLPEWMPAEVWEHWREHRKTIRKPLTDAAAELTLRNLAEMFNAGHDPVAAIQMSIQNGWTGVFPPKPQARASPAQTFKTAADKQAEAIFKITGGLAGKPPVEEVIDVEPFRQRQLAGR